MRRQVLAIPFVRKLRMVRRPRVAVEELAGDRVALRRAPLEVGPENAIVAAAGVLAVGEHHADERDTDVVTDAADGDGGPEILVGQIGALGAGKNDAPTATILG